MTATAASALVITTSMGRRKHIEQTVPSWLDHGAQQVLVVDWSCPGKTADYLDSLCDSRIRTVRVTGEKNFHKSRAWNRGIAASEGYDWLLFFDADTLVVDDRFFQTPLVPGTMTIVEPRKGLRDLTGALLVEREPVMSIEGFDEKMTGWGGEDLDIRLRLHRAGQRVSCFEPGLLKPIAHGDDLRVKHHKVKDPNRSNGENLRRMYDRVRVDRNDPVIQLLLGNGGLMR